MITIDIRKSKNCNGDYSLFLSFPYNDQIVNTVRQQPTRYWNKESKEWEVPAKRLSTLISAFNGFEVEIKGEITELCESQRQVCTDFSDFTFKTTPFAHQTEGFKFGLEHERWLLADEQGLGKTKQVIDIATYKKQYEGLKRCLIVCGVNGLKWNWVNEVRTHSNESAWILGQKTVKGRVRIGSTADKVADLDNLNRIDSFFIVTNVESLRNEEVYKRLSKLCSNGTIDMVAIDEIHKCKNPTSQQGKGILKLAPKFRIAMTGTPVMNNPLDLYVILKWLGYEKHAFYSFRSHYCVMGGYGGYEVVGYRNMNELYDQVHDIMLRRLKKDVLDLPDKLYIDEYVEMGTKQSVIYREVTSDIKAHIDQIKMANNPLAELIRMRQATGYTGILSSTVLESAKLDRMEELVQEIVENGNKVVIFSNWTQMTTPIYNRLSKLYKGVIITGETADVERQVNVNHFQNNDECKFIVGTIGAMGTGLTLTAANTVIFLDEPWTMANKQQAIDRCHRIGTKNNVTVYTIMCKDTIDERIHDLVEQKGAIADALVDGKIKGNKTELLNFLIG